MTTYVKRKSDRQEKRTAKEFGGSTQIASGAIDGMKGDVRTEDYLIENKYTEAPSYKLSLATWNKIAKEALRDSFRTPLMQIDVQDVELVIMDEGTFEAHFNFELQADCVIRAGGKNVTIKGEECDYLLDIADVIVIDFYNIPTKLYVVRKIDFLRKLT